MTDARRALSPRQGVAATAAALLLAAAAPAVATAAAPRLTVGSIRSSDVTLDAKQRFVVRGRVANKGKKASPVQLALTLRATGNPTTTWTLGGARIASLKPGRSRAFAVQVPAPTLREAVAKGLVLEVCVRARRGGATLACAKDSRRIKLAVPTRPTPPTPPAPPAPPTPPAPPAPPAPPQAPVPPVFTSGARTTGDSLFPDIGNGGYDAQHYDLDLTYTNVFSQELQGVATIDATATQNLSDFSLDFQTFAVSWVTIDGKLAAFEFDYVGRKLIVTPPAGILAGREFTVQIAYHGVPAPVIDPDGSSEGWVADPVVGATALGEPMGSMGWFPSNNVPTDKATYDIAVTTAPDFQAVSNGLLDSTTSNENDPDDPADDTTTYAWTSDKPMASYLATVSIGRFDTSGTDLAAPGRPLYIYVDTGFTRAVDSIIPNQQRVPAIIDYFAGYYGVEYPFEAAGGIVPRVDVGYALETQSKPTYAGSTDPLYTGPGISTIAHENAHQWFGDLVTLSEWRDIWLNEGITEFSSWLWQANVNGGTAMDARLTSSLTSTSRSYWVIPPANPPEAGDIFNSNAMYRRGATTMTAIRQIFIDTPGLGEDGFRAMMRSWLTDHSFGNVTTEEFIALVKRIDPSRAARWDEFFQQWLYTSYPGGTPITPGVTQPAIWPSNFDTP